jgi:hypothetical protein
VGAGPLADALALAAFTTTKEPLLAGREDVDVVRMPPSSRQTRA